MVALRRHKWLTALLVLIGIAGGIGLAMVRPTIYTAETRLAVAGGNLTAEAVPGFALASQQMAANYARYVDNAEEQGALESKLGVRPQTVTEVVASPIPNSNVLQDQDLQQGFVRRHEGGRRGGRLAHAEGGGLGRRVRRSGGGDAPGVHRHVHEGLRPEGRGRRSRRGGPCRCRSARGEAGAAPDGGGRGGHAALDSSRCSRTRCRRSTGTRCPPAPGTRSGSPWWRTPS